MEVVLDSESVTWLVLAKQVDNTLNSDQHQILRSSA